MPGDSELQRVVRRQRRALLDRDRQTAGELARQYKPVQEAVRRAADEMAARIDNASSRGIKPGRSWAFQEGRWSQMERQIQAQIDSYAGRSAPVLDQARGDMARQAQSDTIRALEAARGPAVAASFDRLPADAIAKLVAVSRKGAPLGDLLAELGPAVARSLRAQLMVGLARGDSPVVVARSLVKVGGLGLGRALTISRTEMIRAYRLSTAESYRNNRSIVKGWVWFSALQPNTCAACYALHGSHHLVDEDLESHPNCRCTQLPDTGSLSVTSGAEHFSRLSSTQQRAILGPAKHDAYQAGKIQLGDMVKTTTSRRWGKSRTVASLQEATRRAA